MAGSVALLRPISGCGEGDYGGQAGACFSEVLETFRPGKIFCACFFCIQDQSFIILKVIQLTGSWARNCDTVQQVVIIIFAIGPEKFPGLSRNGPKVKGSKSF